MNISGLAALLREHPYYKKLSAALAADPAAPVQASDLLDAAKPLFLAALAADPATLPAAARIVVITARPERARELAAALQLYTADPNAARRFPAPDLLPYERIAPDSTIVAARLAALQALTENESSPRRHGGTEEENNNDLHVSVSPWLNSGSRQVIVTSALALMTPTISPTEFSWATRTLRVGQEVDVNELLGHWVELGYEPASLVEGRGQFSRRGGIVDVWPPTESRPVRLEFWGDEIESLRPFDPESQRSDAQIREVAVTPSCELPLWRASEALPQIRDLGCANCRDEVKEEWFRQMEQLEMGEQFEGRELFAAYFGELHSMLAYLRPTDLLIFDDPEAIRLAAEELERAAEQLYSELTDQGELPPGLKRPYLCWSEVLAGAVATRQLELGTLDEAASNALTLPDFEPPTIFTGNIGRAIDEIGAAMRRGERIVIVSQQVQRLRELFDEEDIYATRRKGSSSPATRNPQPAANLVGLVEPLLDPPAPGSLHLLQASLAAGWRSDMTLGATLYTDLELFGSAQEQRRSSRKAGRRSDFEEFLRDLKPGDYVVHVEHGIARYGGLVKMGGDNEREYMLLEYAAGDRLYVPIEQTDRVAPYIGTGTAAPPLHRLGSGDWARAKRKVEQATLELARELLALYAARESAPGHAYPPDTLWQQELEDSFPFTETEDQVRAIEEVKADMENTRPMDRLICGDVGFGKTEVALRAAFKAVMDGKQVAVLVPTTILAQQHFNTFTARMAAYPVGVEMLSRFRTKKEQERILTDLELGRVDIIIGTHRILQKDVIFKDLGLIIVDEEQRFGVRHKERLKQLRTEVDVLTMTATPIPRTLHMAMVGVRDMSVIETPPADRLPIKTYVTSYRDSLVREVILRELERGGQIFFVHNKVQGIGIVERELKALVPEARFAVAHGQMDENGLEKVMDQFINHDIDVLICTTIIESGLDIPNANTLIVDNAAHYGLSQLYQLRGRVGRGDKRAYAYFLYRSGTRVTDVAQERLHTIEQATDLGAGFRIALKDLEIRGAGNLLGPEQHGNVAAVGFDLYTRLLAGAVEEAKGQQRTPEPPPVSIDLPIRAFLPEDYVADASVRVKLYQRLSRTRSEAQVRDLRKELEDRFGPLPEPAANLLLIVGLKGQSLRAGVESIATLDDEFVIQLGAEASRYRMGPLVYYNLGTKLGKAARITQHQIRLNRAAIGNRWLTVIQEILEELAEAEVPAALAATRD